MIGMGGNPRCIRLVETQNDDTQVSLRTILSLFLKRFDDQLTLQSVSLNLMNVSVSDVVQ